MRKCILVCQCQRCHSGHGEIQGPADIRPIRCNRLARVLAFGIYLGSLPQSLIAPATSSLSFRMLYDENHPCMVYIDSCYVCAIFAPNEKHYRAKCGGPASQALVSVYTTIHWLRAAAGSSFLENQAVQ